MSTAAHNPADLKAAFMGMAGGLIAVFLVCWGVMELTNIKFADHAAPGSTTEPAAQTTGDPAAAAGTQPAGGTEPAPGTTTPPAGSSTPPTGTTPPPAAGSPPETR